MEYICRECGYVFSREDREPDYSKIVEMDIPDDCTCPVCGAKKDKIEVKDQD